MTSRRGLSRRQTRALVLVGILIGAVAVPVLASVFTNPVPQSGTIPYETNSGATINVVGSTNTSSGNPFPDDQTVHIETEEGNATFSSTGDVNATVNTTDLTGTWTVVSSLNVTAARLVIDPEDKQAVGVEGDTARLEFRQDITADDGTPDIVYSGTTGTTTIEIRGLQADTYYKLRDVNTNEVLGGAKSDASGTVVMTGLPNSEHTAELESNDEPNFDSTTASPTGSQNDFPTSLSINVSDPDQPGDNVTVEFYLDGTKVGQDSRTTAGEVSTTIDPGPGSHEWHAVATDEAGETTTSRTFEFSTPNNVTFRDELDQTIITGTQVNATFYYGDGQVDERSTTDGNISLKGLPTNSRIVVVVDADGYYQRTVTLEQLSDQTNIFLLTTNSTLASTVEVRFKVDDKTGNYPVGENGTVVEVQKAIPLSGNTEYRIITSDTVGVDGTVTNLEQDVRYRIVVRNSEGDRRVLGAYSAPTSETVTLTIEAADVQLRPIDADYGYNATVTNGTLQFRFEDPDNETEDLHLRIYERGNQSNTIEDTTYPGPHGNFTFTQALTDDQKNTTWVVEWSAVRNGDDIGAKHLVGRPLGLNLDMNSLWYQAGAVGIVLLLPALTPGQRASRGAVIAASVAGVFWLLDLLPAEVGAGAIALGLFIAQGYRIRKRRATVQ